MLHIRNWNISRSERGCIYSLTPWSRVLEKLIITQLVKNIPCLLWKFKVSLLYSQESIISGHYPELDESVHCIHLDLIIVLIRHIQEILVKCNNILKKIEVFLIILVVKFHHKEKLKIKLQRDSYKDLGNFHLLNMTLAQRLLQFKNENC
jgi:hypothetical protein